MSRKRICMILALLMLLAGCGIEKAEQTLPTTIHTQSTYAEPTQQATAPKIPEDDAIEAPDFTVYDLQGRAVKLSDFEGKPVVLNFWASWCGPCKSEMPEFQQAYEKYGAQVHFVIVNLTDGQAETVESAHSYIDGCGYTFPVYYDTSSEAAYTYGVYSIPTSFFIHADGTVEGYYPGTMDLETLEMCIGLILQ